MMVGTVMLERSQSRCTRPDSSGGNRAEGARELEEHFALVENFIFGQKFEEPLFSIFLTE